MQIYIVRPGDTLRAIAGRFSLSAEVLAYVNQLNDPSRLTIGMALLIPTTGKAPSRSMAVNAYAYPNISQTVLEEYIPSLSYLCPFTHMIDLQGQLSPLNDGMLLNVAAQSGVAPLLSVANLDPAGGFSSDIAHAILTQEEAQETFILDCLRLLSEKGCMGVNLDLEYVYPFDRESYNQFLALFAQRLHARGYYLSTALAPKTSFEQEGLLYSAHDYAAHGKYADFCVIMTYEWGYLYGAPQAVSPVNRMREVLNYAVSRISPGKILLGFSNYAYNWALPWKQGEAAVLLSNSAAQNLACSTGAEVKFDSAAMAPYFNYTDSSGKRHIVWYEDARSVRGRLQLVEDYSLAGISIWNINRPYRVLTELIQSSYIVDKFV